MKYTKYKKGFTLLEVIISIAIFAIVAVALLSAFSSGMINIYSSGNKTRAVEKVQSYTDTVWTASENGTIRKEPAYLNADIESVLGSTNHCTDTSKLYISEGNDMKYHYVTDESIDGKDYIKITIVVFYQNKKRNVSLTSIIPVGGI